MADLSKEFINIVIRFVECSITYQKDSFHLDYEFEEYRQSKLIEFIRRDIVGFCLTDKEYEKYIEDPSQEDFVRTAWRRISTAQSDKKGDFGEFLLYAILKYHYCLNHRVAKIKIKTARGDQVKGFDCAHFQITNNKLTLFLGEAKFYQNFTSALRSAGKSLEQLTQIDKIEDEISMLVDNLENESDKEEYKRAREILYSGISRDQINFKIPILLTYDSRAVKNHNSKNQWFEQELKTEIQDHFLKIQNKPFPSFNNFQINFCILPFYSVEDFKEKLEIFREAGS